MEVAFICLNDLNLELVGIVDDSDIKFGRKLFGFNVKNRTP